MTARADGGAPTRLPDFLIIGAPKAGTTALHAALAQHPQLHLSKVKEPKYYLCGDAPPPAYRGPGDAHSNQEWVWRRRDYQALFQNALPDAICGESTPFYLYSVDAQRRIAAERPDVRLIAVLRDPVDRLYSNWMHLWADGLEPCADVVEACRRESERIERGWAPFWHYRGLGLYGRQLAGLYEHFPREQVLLVRYRDLVDRPDHSLDRVCSFLGVQNGLVSSVPSDNSRPFVEDGRRARLVAPLIRAGARVGAAFPPHLWRQASRPLVNHLQNGGDPARPKLTPADRAALLQPFLPDIDLLEKVTGESFEQWRVHRDGDSFHSRRAPRDSADRANSDVGDVGATGDQLLVRGGARSS
jgi:Sulfotransferase family